MKKRLNSSLCRRNGSHYASMEINCHKFQTEITNFIHLMNFIHFNEQNTNTDIPDTAIFRCRKRNWTIFRFRISLKVKIEIENNTCNQNKERKKRIKSLNIPMWPV